MSTTKIKKSYFDVLGLCCSSEIPLIEKVLRPLDGVKEISVIVASRTVIVVHDNLVISPLQIANALNQARLEANVRDYGEGNYINKWPSPYAIACGAFLLLSLLKYVYHPLQWLAIVAVVIGIVPIVLKGYAALRNFTLDTNILALIAVMGSIALRDYLEAAAIVFLFTIAQWLESRASHKATAVMSSLMNMVPQKAILVETGEEIDASEVMVDTILAIKPGEKIPIDGVVVDGKCEIDEKTLTGESFPVFKTTNSVVWAGTINLNGYISVKTTALAEDCAVAKMAKLVEEAQNNKSKTQRFIDKCAKFYTPAIMGISICLAAIPAILKVHNQKHWFHLALVVLVSGCPCGLILSTPVATFCALSKAATSGLLIKGGEYLETLSKIKIIGFDKTGTITRGEFVVTDFECLVDGVSLNTLLYWVSSIETKSSHPMASALIEHGRSLSVEPNPENVEEFENFPGEGIYGKIDGKYIYVGNRKIASRAGCETVPSLGGIREGKSIGYIFLGGVSAGVFSLSDACRSGAKEAINELKSMGIKTAMLTGDSNEAATIAQNQLDGALEVIKAELLPQDKANIIKDFQKKAPTAMVGDGLNDAPALATADIGISMGVSGSALATETGHVILMSNDIRKIPQLVKLARRTKLKIVQNIIFSILTKIAILGLAFGGYPLVWAAVLADVGTCLVVILNSMLLLSQKEGQAKRGCKSHNHGKNKCHSHNHNHDHDHDHNHEHEASDNAHKKSGSSPCQSHFLNIGHKNSCCANVDHLSESKHSTMHDSEKTSCKHMNHGSKPCDGHKKEPKFHNSGKHKHHCLETCDGHEKDHKDEHSTGCSGKHIHFCETKSCKKLEDKHEHRVEIGKIHSHDHFSSDHHCSSHNHDQASDNAYEKSGSSPCHSHFQNFGHKKNCFAYVDQLNESEHSTMHDSAKTSCKHKHHGLKPCDGHEKEPKFHNSSKHKHHCLETCDGHEKDHKDGNGEHIHFCETKKCNKLEEKHEHRVEIGKTHSHDHFSSGHHCHSAHTIDHKHDEIDCIDDKVVNFCTNDNECADHSHDDLKCSSNSRHIVKCCRSSGGKCHGRSTGFGESVGGLPEIVVQ